MCDALSRNTPKLEGIKILLANCLAHYLEMRIIQRSNTEGTQGRSRIGLNCMGTPDKTSQAFEKRQKLW
jgi:hypothetical protein